MDQIKADLEPKVLNSLTDFDYGVWQMPEGTAFIDGESCGFLIRLTEVTKSPCSVSS